MSEIVPKLKTNTKTTGSSRVSVSVGTLSVARRHRNTSFRNKTKPMFTKKFEWVKRCPLPITRVAKDFPRPLVTCPRATNQRALRNFERWAFQRGFGRRYVIGGKATNWRERVSFMWPQSNSYITSETMRPLLRRQDERSRDMHKDQSQNAV